MANEMKKARKIQNWKAVRIVVPHHVGDAEAADLEPQRDHGDQQQDGAGHGVDEELEGRVDLAGAAPHADEQGHGDQHGFPEDEEEDEIQGAEHADHGRLHDQQADHELLDARLDVAPGRQHAQRHDQGRQQDQQQADAVNADGVVDAQAPESNGQNSANWKSVGLRVKPPPELQREEGDGRGKCERPQAQQALAADERRDRGGGQRAEDQHAQQVRAFVWAGSGHLARALEYKRKAMMRMAATAKAKARFCCIWPRWAKRSRRPMPRMLSAKPSTAPSITSLSNRPATRALSMSGTSPATR